MNRTAVHEAGHYLAARQHGLDVYSVRIAGEQGECRFRGHSNPTGITWVTLAGPVVERYFFGDPLDSLTDFGAGSDFQEVDHLDFHDLLAWEDRLNLWAKYNEDELKTVAGKIGGGASV